MEDLPDYYRLTVLLADVEGFSYLEIAEILDVPIGTVMSRLHRGRKQLHKRLYDFARRNRLLPDDEDQPRDELLPDDQDLPQDQDNTTTDSPAGGSSQPAVSGADHDDRS